MELTPRTEPVVRPPVRRRNPLAYVALLLVLVGIGVVAYQALTSASLYFYNADEAVDRKAELGDRRFRLQGTVREDVVTTELGVTFTVTWAGDDVPVRHDGDPPELFAPGIPVVLEGRWDASGDYFASDRILVKHSEQYEADNGDRLRQAEDGAESSTAP